MISGVRPEPPSQGNAYSWPEPWWAGRRKGSFLPRLVTTTGDRADVGAADEGDRPGAPGTLRGTAAAAVGGAGRLGEKQPLEGIAETGMKIQRERNQPSGGFSRGPAASQQGSEGQGSHEGQAEK